MTVAVLISIAVRNGLAPVCATLKVNVAGVGTCVDDIDIDALSAIGRVKVFVECAEAKAVTVGDTGKTPRGVLLDLAILLHGVDF